MKNKGFTIAELLVASMITIFAFSGALYTFIMLQKFWRGGNTQIVLQSRARIAMDKMIRQIRPGLEAQVLNSGNTLKVRLDPNGTQTTTDDIWCQYDVANNKITFIPDISLTNNKVILENVYKSDTRNIFSVNGKNVSIVFEVKDPTGIFGHKGNYIESSATLRNE